MLPFPEGAAKIDKPPARERGGGPSAIFPTVMHRLVAFRWTAFVVLALALVLEVVNGRFWLNDLRVYVMAADALRHGGTVYGVPFGLDTGYYKYAPAVLYLFMPYTLLPFTMACVVHFALIGLALVAVIVRMERILMRHVFLVHAPRTGLRAMLAFLCVAVHLVRELHLGNVNVLLLWAMVAGLGALLDDRPRAAGLLLGVAVLAKPYLALALLPLFATGQWSALGTAMLTAAAGAMLPVLVQGPGMGLELTRAWISAMRAHDTYLTSPHTLRSLLGTATHSSLPAEWDKLFIAMAAGAVFLITWRARRRSGRPAALVLGTAWALTATPLLVVTDVQHFLLALPLIIGSLGVLFLHRSLPLALAFTLCMLAYGTDSTDLWGRDLAERFTRWGLVGWGTLGLLVVSLLLTRRAASPGTNR